MEGGNGGLMQDQYRPPITQCTAFRLEKSCIAQLPAPARAALDHLAQQSAHSQSLRGPISCTTRLLASDNHVVYLLTLPSPSSPSSLSTSSGVPRLLISLSSSSLTSCSSSACSPIGFLKLGRKHLFVSSPSGQVIEISPLCLLDFYISTPFQRHGLGASFLRAVLRHEGIANAPHLLAYDRPSERLLPFLAKHFGLHKYVPQHNHFVIFDEYFSSSSSSSSSPSTTATTTATTTLAV
ncbi:alpha-tubulin n-acetyltransferase [Nannochloropsis oceanica]